MNDAPGHIALIDYVGSKSGMDFYSLELLKALQNKGYTCSCFSNFEDPTEGKVRIERTFKTHTPDPVLPRIFDFCYGYWKATWRAKRNRSSAVIHHYYGAELKELFALGLSFILRLRIVLIVHDVSALGSSDKAWIRNRAFRMAGQLVVHNAFSKKELISILPQHLHSKIDIIRHGNYLSLAETSIKKSDARLLLGIPDDKKIILFFGQIKKAKGLDVLLDAMSAIDSDIHLIIAGKARKTSLEVYQSKIENSSFLKRVSARFAYIDNTTRDYYFRAADAIIIPYLHIYQSGVLLMAMSYGLPAIASNLEPIREVIQDGENGVLFNTADHNGLAQKVNETFGNQERLHTMGQNAKTTMKKEYNWQTIADHYHEVIQKLKR
ncbi:MAG: glycosyltransferase family 4 protein [Flavobacteriales bacterium]